MALSLAIIWLTISANRSLNQASSKQFVMSTQAYAIFFGYLLLADPKGDARHAQPVAKSAIWGIGHRHPPHPLVSVASPGPWGNGRGSGRWAGCALPGNPVKITQRTFWDFR
jgi:hypothetical protein